MSLNTEESLQNSDPILFARIMGKWAALPVTIHEQICGSLGYHYPLRAWGNENGFGFWTMSRLGTVVEFHVGNPPPLKRALFTMKVADEDGESRDHVHWNHKRSNLGNHEALRFLVLRTAFEKMATSGPKHREWIHGLVNEIYPIS